MYPRAETTRPLRSLTPRQVERFNFPTMVLFLRRHSVPNCWFFIAAPLEPVANASQRYHPLRQTRVFYDIPEETAVNAGATSQSVNAGRPPVQEVLLAEQAYAKRSGFNRVKVRREL